MKLATGDVPMTLEPGMRLGPYQVLSAQGAGGMGRVYRARDSRLDRDVAIKVMAESVSLDGSWVARFEREARLASALNHPNVVAVFFRQIP